MYREQMSESRDWRTRTETCKANVGRLEKQLMDTHQSLSECRKDLRNEEKSNRDAQEGYNLCTDESVLLQQNLTSATERLDHCEQKLRTATR
ncbi:hypothetical protein CBR_g84873 [Chara braunii]|uniref:Uncharacterized protein n=1 Tax=Chara braunii TaxID=69332 RepID=A0A388KAY8_CHABU|nr:hypothetical protein CBR_g84873 [Chara braunii]|eukprot:GBG67210.1 hypothetical protein CBR_g84873 [Chara braunii]